MARHLTPEERDRIAQLLHQGAQQKEIARAVRRSPSTISRELGRNHSGGVYYAAQAQRKAERRRRERPLVRKMDDPRINAAVREHGLTYSRFISALSTAGIEVDRKVLSELAIHEPAAFAAIVEQAKGHLPAAA